MQDPDARGPGNAWPGPTSASAPIPEEERPAPVRRKVAAHAYRTTDEDVAGPAAPRLDRPADRRGVYIAALFAFFNRVADAFGLDDPGYFASPPPWWPTPEEDRRDLRSRPLGDRAFLARFDTEADARGWNLAVLSAGLVGVVDVVLAYRSVAVFADPDRDGPRRLARVLRAIPAVRHEAEEGRLVTIPVLYDGEDLAEVAPRTGRGPDEVVALHSRREYRVLAVGFLPGFPYAGDLPAELAGLPRAGSPRPRVPAGSVAIAGRQTGVYPRESPGGWHLLGRTPLRIADPDRGYFPIRAGDRLRFAPIDPGEFHHRRGEWLAD